MAVSSREFHLTDRDFKYLATLIGDQTGIVIGAEKRDMVYGRLTKRLRQLNMRNFSDYCEVLSKGGSDELTHFINALTTNHTHFFRESHHFDQMQKILGRIGSKKRIRLWSAASSIGAEAYTMAMCIKEVMPEVGQRDLKILGTDIDTQVIQKAKEGRFPIDMASAIPASYRKRFTRDIDAKTFEINADLRKMVTFNYLNLLEDWPIRTHFDIIFCRNVVIYFDKPTQAVLFDRIADTLEMGGTLFIGHSENLGPVMKRFKTTGKTAFEKIA